MPDKRLAQLLFACAVFIAGGRIDEVDAGINGGLHGRTEPARILLGAARGADRKLFPKSTTTQLRRMSGLQQGTRFR